MNKTPNTMRGIWLIGHGCFDKHEVETNIPTPSAADGEDASWGGKPILLPRIQGIEVCGDIVAIGKKISLSRIGERVLVEPYLLEAGGKSLESPRLLGSECDGDFAEYIGVASQHAYKTSSALESTELASFPCLYSTSENLLINSMSL